MTGIQAVFLLTATIVFMIKYFHLHSSPTGKCSYLDDKQSRVQIVVPPEQIDTVSYADMLRQGFRRSGVLVYKPNCEDCSACMPSRIDINRFNATKRFRRIINKNSDLQCRQLPLAWHEEHFQLYLRYQQIRHQENKTESQMRADYKEFILDSYINTVLLEYRDKNNQVLMVSLIDIIDDAISAVYTFYEPENKRSLGHYGILNQLELCKILSKSWLYLGYWVKDCRKLAYKMDYQPTEIFRNGAWTSYNKV